MRQFIIFVALFVSAAVAPRTLIADEPRAGESPTDQRHPNFLWIVCEDTSPFFGCYGDARAITPNVDRLASQGRIYTKAFSIAGVCAPSRSCIITGMYPTSIGTHNMRTKAILSPPVVCFTEYLRKAGYYCTNNVKTDYNFDPPATAWDDSSETAHWRNRKPGQPFFAFFSPGVTHESRAISDDKQFARYTRKLPPEKRQDPAKLVLPPYYPDTPLVRHEWAHDYELISTVDQEVGELLHQLDEDGVADNTVVIFCSDHGVGLPRSKRWLYDSGMQVPFVVRWPGKIAPGEKTDRLISFLDMAPTILSIAGVEIPKHLQGHAFLGDSAAAPREYVFAARDRIGERFDILRAVRDSRYKYIRNLEPFKPWTMYDNYSEPGRIIHELRRLAKEGNLVGAQLPFMQPRKPFEELYDTLNDPHEVHNLANSPEHRETLTRLRAVQQEWAESTKDLGLIPEPEIERLWNPHGMFAVARDEQRPLPLEKLSQLAQIAATSHQNSSTIPQLLETAKDDFPAVRYWAAISLGQIGQSSDDVLRTVRQLAKDESPSVRIAAGLALDWLGRPDEAVPVLGEAFSKRQESVRLMAGNAIQLIGESARPLIPQLQQAMNDKSLYVARLANHTLNELLGTDNVVP